MICRLKIERVEAPIHLVLSTLWWTFVGDDSKVNESFSHSPTCWPVRWLCKKTPPQLSRKPLVVRPMSGAPHMWLVVEKIVACAEHSGQVICIFLLILFLTEKSISEISGGSTSFISLSEARDVAWAPSIGWGRVPNAPGWKTESSNASRTWSLFILI